MSTSAHWRTTSGFIVRTYDISSTNFSVRICTSNPFFSSKIMSCIHVLRLWSSPSGIQNVQITFLAGLHHNRFPLLLHSSLGGFWSSTCIRPTIRPIFLYLPSDDLPVSPLPSPTGSSGMATTRFNLVALLMFHLQV